MMKNSQFKLALFDTKVYDRLFFDRANAQYGFDITYFETKLRSRTAALSQGFDVVCAFVNDELDEEVIQILDQNRVRLIAMRCAGFNNVNVKAACDRGMPVMRVPQYSPYAVAEYALGLLLTLNRKIHRAFNRVREGNFSINGLAGFDLRGKTVGIVGTGRIGRCFAGLLQGFGVRISAYDLHPDPALQVEFVPLEKLFRESDVISLHCPLTPGNIHLVNAQTIAMMKPGVFLLNTSRGKLIDSAALIEGLKSGQIGAAGLDVYEEETDYFFEDRSDSAIADDKLARLVSFPNVIVTSHQAFFTQEALTNIAETTLQNVENFFLSGNLDNAVCQKCGGRKNCPGKKPGEQCMPNLFSPADASGQNAAGRERQR